MTNGQFSNDEAGIAGVLTRLRDLPVALVLMEATGGFERALAQHLCMAGMAVIVVNPRQAHDFGKAMGYLAKTDHLDARVLSHFARTLAMVSNQLPLIERFVATISDATMGSTVAHAQSLIIANVQFPRDLFPPTT